MKRQDKAKEIADELRASAMTPQALARKRQKELLETLEWLLATSDNRAIFVARAKEKFELKVTIRAGRLFWPFGTRT
ncbi:MAG: hypothetical protein WCC59_07405 [Terriglobales bacterium]